MIENWKPLYHCGWDGYHTLLDALTPQVAFDLGANEGGIVQEMLAHGVEQVHAFEPVPDVCGRLRELFKNDKRVIVNQIGLADCCTVLHGVLPTFAWALLSEGAGAVAKDYVTHPRFDVRCVSLDGYVNQTGIVPDHIKIDVDGYECHVLEGGRRLLTEHRPWMLFELSELTKHVGKTAEQMCNLIYELGYKAVSLDLAYICPDVQALLERFPYHSSYDVFLLPEQLIKEITFT